jgi:site-specific DNA-methyltransferase (adenine-specific)
MNGRNRESEHIFEGYSGCGCDAGFEGGIVLDPFFGAGTTGLVTLKQNKRFIGIELNPEYIKIAEERLKPYLQQKKLTEVQNVEWQ